MEEVQVIDCPPTPEILLASNTPLSTSLLDMLDSSSSAEEVDNCSGDGNDESMGCGRRSPPPKCAICLGKCRQKCYTDSCRHQFCYRCLLEWSKIKAECPLCKQVFRSIIYNQKTFDQYEEHIISIVPPASPPASSNREGQGTAYVGGIARSAPQVYHRLDFTLSQPPRFTYSATLRVQPSQSERLQQLFLHQSSDVQRFSREYPDDSIPSRQNGAEWRRYIYHRRLHARPLPDINGRMRECSSAFYRENPAQIHRLMPWINRELIALGRANQEQMAIILEDFPNLLMAHDITSPAFRERVSYWGRARTAHFIHELLNFARSPYDMIGYDQCVQYDPYYNSVVVLSSSSSTSSASGLSGSEGDEDDAVRIVEPIPSTSGPVESIGGGPSNSRRGRTQFTIETRSSDQTVIMTGSFGGVSGIVSLSTSGTQTNASTDASSSRTSNGFSADIARMQPLTSIPAMHAVHRRLEAGENISLSSSDSDDCRIVGALKPPHLRTPEMVSLASESDSDVVFVNDPENAIPDTNHQSSETISNLPKVENNVVLPASEYNNGASTSSGGGGVVKKLYARPKLNRYASGIGFKSIYEASESEDDKNMSSESGSSSHEEVKFKIRNSTSTISSTRKRKATKRRKTTSKSNDYSSDESSTSDSESTPTSSTSSCSVDSSSSSSSDSSDNENDPPKIMLKKRSHRTKDRSSSKKSVSRRRKETKKRCKAKKRKSVPTKRARTRQKVLTKTSKSSSESGKGTSVSCTSIPSTETFPVACSLSPKSSTNTRKRKLQSVVMKPPSLLKSARPGTARKRRKVPICSELITSTDFSSDANEPVQEQTPAPVVVQEQAQQLPCAKSSSSSVTSSSDNDSSDSSEGRCAIASLIRAAQHAGQCEQQQSLELEKYNTSSMSGSNLSHTEASSSSLDMMLNHSHEQYTHEQPQPQQHNPQIENQHLQREDDVSVTQAIAVGAEVEL